MVNVINSLINLFLGAKNWFLTADWSVHNHQQKRGNSRQATGMAGHVSPYIRIPFFHERGPGVGIDLSLQARHFYYSSYYIEFIVIAKKILNIASYLHFTLTLYLFLYLQYL